MEIRRLEPWEHGKTRKLYEEVFTEDDNAFVSYYYKWKTRDSRIYAAEEDGQIRAMVHLNPFSVWVKGSVQKLHYIVAVATQREYRDRGLMRALLELAEQEMARDKERFTFLMPAAEQIYAPLGYRFFSRQRCGILRGEVFSARSEAVVRPVSRKEYAALAEFVNGVLSRQYDVFVYRDAAYYERLCAEQECQGGQVMVICLGETASQGRILGTFCTSSEAPEGLELREIILDPAKMETGRAAVQGYIGALQVSGCRMSECQMSECQMSECRMSECQMPECQIPGYQMPGCRVSGCQREFLLDAVCEKPLLMAKVPCGGIFCSEWAAERVFINEVV